MENRVFEQKPASKFKKGLKSLLFFVPLAALVGLFVGGQINFNPDAAKTGIQNSSADGDKGNKNRKNGKWGNGEEQKEILIPVETSLPGTDTLYALYSGTATLYADNKTEVSAKVGGQITQVFVEEGDLVKQGQVLAKIEADRYRLEVERAQANLNKITQEITRKQDLYEQKLIPRDSFESLKYDKDSASVALSIAKLDLDHVVIRAPISGVISKRMVQKGNVVNINQSSFEITSLNPLQADLYIPERELNKIKTGQVAQVLFDALKGTKVVAVVKRISPIIDSKTGTLKTTLEIDNSNGNLKPGMFGRFNVIFDQHDNAMTLPRTAIDELDDEKNIYHIVDGKAQRVVVKTGLENKGKVEILDGLSGTEAVVILGQSGLRQGTKVKVVTGPETQTPEYKAELKKLQNKKEQLADPERSGQKNKNKAGD